MKTIKLKKKTWIIIILNSFFLLAFGVLILSYSSIAHKLQHEHMDKVWAGESNERYAQVSCFLPVNSTLTEADIDSFRHKIDDKLLEISLEAEEGKSLYVDAYSASSQLTIKNGSRSANVSALGVSENYFFFHSLPLKSGSYLSAWDLMRDRVVLDDNTAWNLFGSFDVAGMQVTIDDKPFVVAGVVTHNQDHASKLAEENTAAIAYVDYSIVAESHPITCYELIMPNPISDFAITLVNEEFPLGEQGQALENSRRFRPINIAKLFFSYAKRLMIDEGIAYPSWENAARYLEVKLGGISVVAALCMLFPLITLIALVVYWYRKLYKYLKQRIEDRRITA